MGEVGHGTEGYWCCPLRLVGVGGGCLSHMDQLVFTYFTGLKRKRSEGSQGARFLGIPSDVIFVRL